MRITDKIFGAFSQDIGIDLGTANTLVYVRGRGIVINEPSVVAINKRTGDVLAIGRDAQRMVGKTPAHIVAVRPLRDGVISDFEVTEQMLRYFIQKVHQEGFHILPRPRVVIGIPSSVTEVERRAVEEACLRAGARNVYLIEESMASAIGSRMPVHEATGNMIVDIGGGTTEVAVISLGGIVVSRTIRVAGDEMNENIVQYARDNFNMLVGERSAEEVKIRIGSVVELASPLETPIRGRDLVTGLPKEVMLSDTQVREALQRSITAIVSAVRNTVEETPPELISDIIEQGIMLAGGGSLIRGLDQVIRQATQIKTKLTDDPLTSVVRGTGIVLEDLEAVQEMLLPSVHDVQLK
ncbi:MAG: rod shape-determining protein [Candidatus Andersenbacteria bacterium RIFCSPHIGHO2_12_FULL_46_9]|nr:MAG: Rod shape-determining protein [Parcubacteria group bacterium GW2011_GWA2_45_14]OGY34789.1 MAG: rod shape-determining protein [Candidatus Andersenbacteria bacterium RIFCSPHIGHO2_02_FULL_46_16]OGY35923.1 MAG: rod shape-determining protein [Candidatus Andersenbacteria bacterium RIFCSPHIGHO2_12_FULL_46_9]OGY38144.1 MAG: rod shape-determining protein [Candidatus Andersenbacteria bacterium RIFCSPLOWO2_02_FULL_46_11]OGY40147.1 MAG: rod shape-determining protein [Candidatus Andersenbacteria bac